MSDPVERVAKAIFELDEMNGDWDDIAPGIKIECIKEARAAIAAMRDPWQPIETAPRDGTQILILDKDGESIEITEWYQLQGHGGGWEGNGHRATHWMPLPEPPK